MNGTRILTWRPETLATGNDRPRASFHQHGNTLVFVDTKTARVNGGNRSIINYGNVTRINILRQYIEEHPMLLMCSRGFKDIVTKTAFFKEFPGLENKFQNSRGFKEIKDPYEP